MNTKAKDQLRLVIKYNSGMFEKLIQEYANDDLGRLVRELTMIELKKDVEVKTKTVK